MNNEHQKSFIEIEEIFQIQEQISQDILTDMNSRDNDRKDKFDLIFNDEEDE